MMTKKIILALIFIIVLFSCGRKDDPKYNDEKQAMLFKKTYEIY